MCFSSNNNKCIASVTGVKVEISRQLLQSRIERLRVMALINYVEAMLGHDNSHTPTLQEMLAQSHLRLVDVEERIEHLVLALQNNNEQ